MKNRKKQIIKLVSIIIFAVVMMTVFTLPALAADETSNSPQILFKPFDGNEIIKTIFAWLEGVIGIGGIGTGLFLMVWGAVTNDPGKKTAGLYTALLCVAVVVLMMTLVNMMIA